MPDTTTFKPLILELTRESGISIFVNANQIVSFAGEGDFTFIATTNNGAIYVIEKPSKIMALINAGGSK
jgi:hypothetical protein